MIRVLTGQRRVGKTTILKQIMDLVRQEDFNDIVDAGDLYQFVKSKVSGNKNNYAFIDEIQEINEFETALRQLFVEGIDLYCTGSNARMLSGDLATHLSGRYIEFHINSLSYNEFLQFHSLQNSNDSLSKYIRFGGLPYLIHFRKYLQYGPA